MKMLSVTSLSGGKTSSYMAIHYPTDKYVFAVVKTTDPNAVPKDKGLLKEIQDRIPGFVASRELDETLLAVLRLEQEIGQKIDWVSSELTYDDLIRQKQLLPNRRIRACTQELKIRPIFEYCYNLPSLGGMVSMNIGFRWDEKNRASKLLEECDKAYSFRYPFSCSTTTKKQQWKTIEYRIPNFPLIDNHVSRTDVLKYWLSKGWSFPSVSNCDFCFFHSVKENREQLEKYPERFKWWESQEEGGRQWNNEYSYSELRDSSDSIKELPLFSCHCTD